MKRMTEKQFQSELKKIQLKNKEFEYRNKLRKERNKYRRFIFSKPKTSNIVLSTSIMAVILFTVICLYIQYKTNVEVSSTLITLWYSFWTVEIVSLAGIRVSKVFKNSNDANSTVVNSDESNESDIG